MRPPQDDRTALWLWVACAAIGVMGLLAALCIAYSGHFPNLGRVGDLWFGADISRHIRWILQPDSQFRSHLHPGSFVLFKVWGFVLRALGIVPGMDTLVVFAVPVIMLTGIGMTVSVTLIVPSGPRSGIMRTAMLVLLLVVGPILIFGPMPESHVLGGVALLLQAALTWRLMHATAGGKVEPNTQRWTALAIVCAAVATAVTLSNLVPAAILLLPVVWLHTLRGLLVRMALAATAAAAVAVVGIFSVSVESFRLAPRLIRVVGYELRWLMLPDRHSIGRSFEGLIVSEFGVPASALTTWQNPFTGLMVTSVGNLGVTGLQTAGFLAWCMGVLLWARPAGRGSPERWFLRYCLLAALSLIAFHSAYATDEAYLFSAHMWPYLVLPAVLAWTNGVRTGRVAPVVFITAAVAFSAVQTGVGLAGLRGLPPTTGQRQAGTLIDSTNLGRCLEIPHVKPSTKP